MFCNFLSLGKDGVWMLLTRIHFQVSVQYNNVRIYLIMDRAFSSELPEPHSPKLWDGGK